MRMSDGMNKATTYLLAYLNKYNWVQFLNKWLLFHLCNRIGATMAVSAYWHGIHPGYYMTFLSVPFYLAAEDSLVSKESSTPDKSSSIQRWICWFIRMRSNEYLGVGFLFLGFKETLRYWTSVYFYGHVVILGGVLVGMWSVMNKGKNKVQWQTDVLWFLWRVHDLCRFANPNSRFSSVAMISPPLLNWLGPQIDIFDRLL